MKSKSFFSAQFINQSLKVGFILLFFGILWLPRIQQKTHFFYYNLIDENRIRTLRPEGNILINFIKESNTFPKKYEKYFNDNYGLRDPMIRLTNSLDHRIFNVSDEVAFGPDDWMEYRNVIENQEIANERISPAEFQAIVNRFNKLSVDLKKDNITLVVVPIPNKNSIYPELFPTAVKRPSPTAFERLTTELQANSNFYTIDAAPILKDKKNGIQVFYKTDFHWNEIGAYYVSAEVVNFLGTLSKTNTKWTLPFEIEEQAFQGVLNSSLSTIKVPTETGYFIAKPEGKFESNQKLLPKSLVIGNSFYIAMRDIHFADFFTTLDSYDLVHSKSLYTQLKGSPGIKYVIFEFVEVNMAEEINSPKWWDAMMQ